MNPNTVQRAYQELERQGLVCTRKGLGIFVAKNGDVSAQSKSEVTLYSRLSQAVQAGMTAGITPERIEGLFQKALRNEAAKASHTEENA